MILTHPDNARHDSAALIPAANSALADCTFLVGGSGSADWASGAIAKTRWSTDAVRRATARREDIWCPRGAWLRGF